MPSPSLSLSPAPPAGSQRSGLTQSGPSTPHPDRKPASVGAPFETSFYQYHQSQERTLQALSSGACVLQKSGDRGRAVRNPQANHDSSFLTEMTAKAALPEPRSRTSVLPAPGCPWPWLSLSLVAALALSQDRRARGRGRWAPLRPRAGPRSVLNIHRDRYFLKGESTARETSQPRGRTKEGLCSCIFPRLGRCSPSPLTVPSD